ncbi:hypothetical protein LCGC14_0521320 [marine sediment metagenome]|uniref:Uncharacterized protein n=1 Tax=marine sediment metagenome TaxID=412755 RepID=A0A0F9SGT2_9ZZZZ
MEKLVITRYQSLVEYLKEIGLIDEDTKILTRAEVKDVKGKHVLGVLPYWLSCHASKYTEVQIRVPSERKGKELSLEEVQFYSLEPKTYRIKEVPFENEKK